jgi:glycogen phosphorylase
VDKLRRERANFAPPERFLEVLAMVSDGHFGWQEYFSPLVHSLERNDHYLVANDFQSYIDMQVRVSM